MIVVCGAKEPGVDGPNAAIELGQNTLASFFSRATSKTFKSV